MRGPVGLLGRQAGRAATARNDSSMVRCFSRPISSAHTTGRQKRGGGIVVGPTTVPGTRARGRRHASGHTCIGAEATHSPMRRRLSSMRRLRSSSYSHEAAMVVSQWVGVAGVGASVWEASVQEGLRRPVGLCSASLRCGCAGSALVVVASSSVRSETQGHAATRTSSTTAATQASTFEDSSFGGSTAKANSSRLLCVCVWCAPTRYDGRHHLAAIAHTPLPTQCYATPPWLAPTPILTCTNVPCSTDMNARAHARTHGRTHINTHTTIAA